MSGPPRPAHPFACPAVREHLVDVWQPGRPVRRAIDSHPLDWNAGAAGVPVSPRTKGAWELAAASQAALWWVSPEMFDVLEAAAPTVPDAHVLRLEDVPTPYGIAFWPRSYVGLDANEGLRACHVDAVVWGPVRLPPGTDPESPDSCWGIGISSYRVMDADKGLSASDLGLATMTGAVMAADLEGLGEYAAVRDSLGQHLATRPMGKGKDGEYAYRLHGHLWCPLGRSDWVVGREVTHRILREDAAHASAVEDRRLMAALWSLSMTPAVAETTVEHPPRAVARKSERKGRDASVRVVYLRRRTKEADGEKAGPGKVDWSCRWIVGAHPRLQPYGPGRSLRRLIWVGPYEKGPAGKPLKVRQPVRAWVR